jgi:hypothetical protein
MAKKKKSPHKKIEAFVLDGSVTLAWCFSDEADPYADAVARMLPKVAAIVPAIWHLDLWTHEKMPVILILFDASRRRAWWLDIQHYFQTDADRRPKPGARTVRVRVPAKHVVNRRAVATFRNRKRAALEREIGEER